MKLEELRRRRETARKRPLRPYEPLHVSPARWSKRFLADVDRRLADGWSMGPVRQASIAPPVAWVTENRSFDTHWHAWWPLDVLFAAHELNPGDDRYVDAAWPFAWDWLQTFQKPVLAGRSAKAAIREAFRPDGSQAWYDMSVGLRLHRLGYLTDLACRDDRRSDEEIRILFEAMDFHHRLMLDDRLFRNHNNHGIFQALGQIAACARFPDAPAADHCAQVAAQRLRTCLDEHFFDSGVHKEHSPGYHMVLLDALISARSHGLLDSFDLAWLDRAEEALGWMITPTGALAAFGDTDRSHPSYPPDYVRRFRNPTVRAMLGGGVARGGGMAAYLEAGYVFSRRLTQAGPNYFAHQCGFHSRAHKHADHLNFIWFARDREILTDPGRFSYRGKTQAGSDLWRNGFWYDDPRRLYIERTRAHNVVQIDDHDHARMDVEPFGSALISADASGGQVVTEAALEIEPGVHWRRVLAHRANAFMVVIDSVEVADGKPRDLRQWFTLGQTWNPTQAPGVFKSSEPKALALSILNLGEGVALEGVWRGESKPELRGWVAASAHRLEPTCSLALFAPRVASARFVTVFTFGATAKPHETKPAMDDVSLEGTVKWIVGDRDWELEFHRNHAGVLTSTFAVTAREGDGV